MIKVYFDWNVMAQMKNGQHPELKKIAFENDNLFKPYSSSHVSDIFSSFKENDEQTELINQDLEFISNFTNNAFLFNTGKEILMKFIHPIEYYTQLVEEKDQFKDLSIEGLFAGLETNEFTRDLIKPIVDLLKEIPLDPIFRESFENPKNSGEMETMFPELKDNLTMEGFFQSFSKSQRDLNEDEKYNDFRKIIQKGFGINRDKIFDNKSPYDLIESQYKQLGITRSQPVIDDKIAPGWFSEISNEYIHLDMHGYQEDNVNTKRGRKETFKNTSEDAFHAAFASTCNFYVINDKKAYKKAKQVFEKLKINTIVLRPDEFVKYHNEYLHFKDPNLNLDIPLYFLKNGKFYEEDHENYIMRTYFFRYFFFGFFTKLVFLIPKNQEPTVLLLSRDKPTNNTTYTFEICKLSKDIIKVLGEDIDGLGEVKEDELTENQWNGRSWKVANLTLRLVNPNGHFQLYLDFEEK